MNSTVIVTGVPRSGTSLQMQTLRLLGMEIVGDEFPQLKSGRDEESLERSKQLNPKGFYEDHGAVMRGTQDKEKLQGKAIKIIVDGLPERLVKHKDGEEIEIGTSSEIIDDAKIILCLRDPMQVAESQTHLMGNVHIADDKGEFQDMTNLMPENPERYAVEMGRFYFWLKKMRPELEEKMLKIDFEDMHDQSEIQINRIIEFTSISCTEEQHRAAISNVSGDLRRAIHTKKWRPEHETVGTLAVGLYRYFRYGEDPEERLIEDFLIDRVLENVSWVDTEVGLWTRSNPVFHRQLLENLRGLRDKMILQYKGRRNQSYCEHFKYSQEEYTMPRPKGLGDLVRKKVACKKDNENKTLEQCYVCFHQGRMF